MTIMKAFLPNQLTFHNHASTLKVKFTCDKVTSLLPHGTT